MPHLWPGALLSLACRPALAFSVAFVNPGCHETPCWLSTSRVLE